MPIDAETRRAIEKKARLFDATKSRTEERIKSNIRMAIEKLQSAERELLDEVEIEFGENPFSSFLSNEEGHTEEEIRSILSKEIPSNFGPSEESFCSLCREIESFKTWERKVNPFDLIPQNLKCTDVTWDTITVSWDGLNLGSDSFYEIELRTSGSKDVYHTTQTQHTFTGLRPETDYHIRACTVSTNGSKTMWCDSVTVQTTNEPFTWNGCYDYIKDSMKYSVDKYNPKIAMKTEGGNAHCTIIDTTPLLPGRVSSWSIKVLNSERNNGSGIYIGIAPSDINQNIDRNFDKCGWYFGCYDSRLFSGPPHNYDNKTYGPRKRDGTYVHTGDSVGVVMDTTKGELSFVVYGVNLGVAFEGIPLDKPLVPCVLLENNGDSVELATLEMKEKEVDSSVPVPSNITAKYITWDTISLTWDPVGGGSFYQIEVDGSKSHISFINTFTKRGLLPESEHTFRVRTVKGNSASEWSDVVKETTQKILNFDKCEWKDCPDNFDEDRKYYVDNWNPRIATKKGTSYCIIIGNTPLPLNKVTSWSIKILNSERNNGSGIFIGVAQFDVDHYARNIQEKCGWYFDCYYSKLCSGPPHNYRGKEYGPRKGEGEYIHNGDSVGVVMDTAKGELFFALNGVNFGAAYEGIPLDKPLVPCVILRYKGDSINLDTSEMKENMDNTINTSNIAAKSITWDSITLTWDIVEGASFYQIEVDGSKIWSISTTNEFKKRDLPDSEHSFRVRTVRGNAVSEWSDVVKGRIQKELFEASWWKECPGDVDKKRKYSIDKKNPRIICIKDYQKIHLVSVLRHRELHNDRSFYNAIGNTPLPRNIVASWSIKVLKSRDNDGGDIFIGVAPFDINQNEDRIFEKCGWYFGCGNSVLLSGPPHKYRSKAYGPKKENGEYVHTGDVVGVVMDTTKGDLSFVLSEVNLGVAYEGIPLDKPLVPCVILLYKGDSVELVI